MEIELAASLKLRLSSKNDAKEKVKEKSAKALLIKEEERETGFISGKVLSRYMMALGGAWVIGVFFSAMLWLKSCDFPQVGCFLPGQMKPEQNPMGLFTIFMCMQFFHSVRFLLVLETLSGLYFQALQQHNICTMGCWRQCSGLQCHSFTLIQLGEL